MAPQDFLERAIGRSLFETFMTSVEPFPIRSTSSLFSPTLIAPSMMAIVAGIAPFSLIIFSKAKEHSIFFGRYARKGCS